MKNLIGNRLGSQSGFTLIELMVGLFVGLLVVLAILSSTALLNMQRKITVSGANAQASALNAIAIISREARQAGAGFFNRQQLLCTTINIYYNGTVVSNGQPFMPVSIADGGSASDSVVFSYANSTGGLTTANVVKDMPNPSSNFTVNHQGGLAVGDVALIGVPGSNRPCTLFNITAVTPGGGNCGGVTNDCVNIQHNSGSSGPYNPPNPNNAFSDSPTYGYVNNPPSIIGPAVIARMGSFRRQQFLIRCGTLVSTSLTDSGVPSCTSSPLSFTNLTPQVNDVVYMKAQYGIVASASSDEVTSWESATGSWQNPTAASIPLIKAIRVVLIARDKDPSVENVSTACTNQAGVVNVGPCSFQDSDAPIIDLSGITVATGKTWRNYRYKVYMNIIPLRNVAWNY